MAMAAFVPAVFYKDPVAAIRFLEKAFGFEIASLILDGDGKLAHSQLSFADASVQIGGEWEGSLVGSARMRSPQTVEGVNIHFVLVILAEGFDEQCVRSRAAGERV